MATVMLVRTAELVMFAYAVPEKPELGFRVSVLMQDLTPRLAL